MVTPARPYEWRRSPRSCFWPSRCLRSAEGWMERAIDRIAADCDPRDEMEIQTPLAGAVIGRIRALIRKAPARKDAVEVNDAILEAIALTRTEAANNSVSVRTQLAEGLPRVQGDRVQLQQVLLNLIINAIEAMRDVGEQKRELLISSRSEPDGVSVEVRDSGPGLAPADFECVFEAFYTTKPGGLGLGLSICRSIIEAHNGTLSAHHNVPRGAIFRFTAPAHPAAASNFVGDGVECAEADNSAHVSPSG
jgi:signal transduction histidine kinase